MSGVNRILWVWVWAAGCHLGRPPLRTASVSLGALEAAVLEPGLADALRAGMADALSSRGMLGEGGPEVRVEVRDASTRLIASDGVTQVATARLTIAVSLGGPEVRRVLLTDEQSYGIGPGKTLDASAARARAFASLARSLTDQAAAWIRYAPTPEPL